MLAVLMHFSFQYVYQPGKTKQLLWAIKSHEPFQKAKVMIITKGRNKGLAFSKVTAWGTSFQHLGPVQCPVCTLSYFLSLNWPECWSAWCISLLCIRLSVGITHIRMEKVTSLPAKWKVSCNEIGSVFLKTMSKIGSVKCEVLFE